MAYMNISRYKARRFQKVRGIHSVEQAECILRSHAYLAWDIGLTDNRSQANYDHTYGPNPESIDMGRTIPRAQMAGGLLPFWNRYAF